MFDYKLSLYLRVADFLYAIYSSSVVSFLMWNALDILWLIRWQESYSRFKHIFGLNAQGRYTNNQVYFIPGNHDIGYASLHNQRPEVF
jgi:hypothetical protein